MKWISRSKLVGTLCGALGALCLVPGASAGSRKEHPYRYSILDMPVSLAAGTVRTPEFSVGGQWYWIMIQVEKPLPFMQMVCMMGVTTSPLDLKDCSSNDPLLRADWTVWDQGHIVFSGSSTTKADDMYTNKYIFKFLGSFAGEAGEEVRVGSEIYQGWHTTECRQSALDRCSARKRMTAVDSAAFPNLFVDLKRAS